MIYVKRPIYWQLEESIMLKKLFRTRVNREETAYEQQMHLSQSENIPSHIAIIMDGNGRWARNRSMPRIKGHHEGMKTVKTIAKCANRIGVKILTLYAFSTENWKRPKAEVEFLMNLPEKFLASFLPELMELNMRVQMIGDFESLPAHTQNALKTAMEETKNNTGMILNFAMNYGSRDEMIRAMKAMYTEIQKGQLAIEDVTEETVTKYLYTAQLPEPDLLIRTSGEVRLSNFMLWQLAYTEFWFTDVLWPDFDENCLIQAITVYQNRNRRYGGLKGEEDE